MRVGGTKPRLAYVIRGECDSKPTVAVREYGLADRRMMLSHAAGKTGGAASELSYFRGASSCCGVATDEPGIAGHAKSIRWRT